MLHANNQIISTVSVRSSIVVVVYFVVVYVVVVVAYLVVVHLVVDSRFKQLISISGRGLATNKMIRYILMPDDTTMCSMYSNCWTKY